MKKFITCFILLFCTVKILEAQQNYISLGDESLGPYCIWVIKVNDEFNDAPIRNARVELYDATYKIFSIRTNIDGLAVIVIYEITQIRSGFRIKVNDADFKYSSWEKEILQLDYYGDKSKERMLILGDANNNIIDWSSSSFIPTASRIADAINNGKYRIFETRNSNFYYRGPGFFEFNVKLKYLNHPKENSRINNYNYQKNDYSTSKTNEIVEISEWRELKIDNTGNIYKVYSNGKCEIMISELNKGEYSVGMKSFGELVYRYIDELGNITHYKGYTLPEAIRIANNYMHNH